MDWERHYAGDLSVGVKRKRRGAGTWGKCPPSRTFGLATVVEEIKNTWKLEEASGSQEDWRLKERAGLAACRHHTDSERRLQRG